MRFRERYGVDGQRFLAAAYANLGACLLAGVLGLLVTSNWGWVFTGIGVLAGGLGMLRLRQASLAGRRWRDEI